MSNPTLDYPTPWRRDVDRNGEISICDAHGYLIADQVDDNCADTLAAAGDLLMSLMKVLWMAEKWAIQEKYNLDHIAEARKTISRATGGTDD